jgi:GT2 family glycosyltransferase
VARSLSVVVPSFNRPDLLRLCLSSLRRHAPANVETIVVDDASPGGAVRAVVADFPEVQCLSLPRRRGFCAAVNAGVEAATSPIVELLNDDAEVGPGWAAAALARFADPTVAAVAPLVLLGPPDRPGPPLVDSAGDRYFVGGVAGKRGHGRPLTAEHLQPRPIFAASGSSAFYRRDALRVVGAFPERFRAYFEDVDAAFRLHRAGWRVVYEPAARVWHRVSASYGRRPSWQVLAQQARNEERVFWRNLPGRTLWQALPLHLAVLAAKAWRRLREGGLLPFLCGRLGVVGEWLDVWRHRRRWAAAAVSEDVAAWGVESAYWG